MSGLLVLAGFDADPMKVWDAWREKAEAIEPFPVPLEKMDIRVEDPVVLWAPTA